MDRNPGAGHRQNDASSMGTLESDDCCGVGLTNYSPKLSARYAFEDHVPSVSKAEWARPPPHPRDFVSNCFPTVTSEEDICNDSGVALSCPQADCRVRSFSTSSNSADFHIRLSNEERRVGWRDDELLALDICNLRISDEVGSIPLEQKADQPNESVQTSSNDVDDYRMNWDLIFEQDEDGDT